MNPRVLAADVEPSDLDLVRHVLERTGVSVITARDGHEVIEVFTRQRPDLVVLGARLPGQDGVQTTEAIRSLPGGELVPILFMTGADDDALLARALEAGASDFATKPLDAALLTQRVRYLLRTKRTLEDLKHREGQLAEAQRHARVGHWEWDSTSGRMDWSEMTWELLGADASAVSPSRESFLASLHAEDRERATEVVEAALRGESDAGVDVRVVLPDGATRHLHLRAVPLAGDRGRPPRVSGTVQDISERKVAEQKVQFLAYYDSLTHLPNRMFFLTRLALAMDVSQRDKTSVAVFFLDLDEFKQINDTFGHRTGDLVLEEVADRLRKALRKTDCVARSEAESDPHVVARFGGDEFLILATGIARPRDAARVARRVLESLALPIEVEGKSLSVTCSVGISVYPHDGRDAESLLTQADAAMYRSKQLGPNRYCFHDRSLHDVATRRLSVEDRLRRALENEELVVHFQPIVDEATSRIAGAEALIRWRHPDRGLLPPAEFIEISEETGLIVPIGDWVLRQALAEARAWQTSGHHDLSISINVSARQFRERQIARLIGAALEQSGAGVRGVELEINESLLVDMEDSDAILRTLREMGLGIVLDDFGAGYSSLSYLPRSPVSALKIDRHFVSDMERDSRSAALTSSIISIAKGLRISLIAEGVETREQAAHLRRQGCRLMQGFLFGKPMSADEFRTLLTERAERRSSEGDT